MADDDGACRTRLGAGVVVAPVVDDEHQVDVRDRARGADGRGDPLGLVLGRDDRGHALVDEREPLAEEPVRRRRMTFSGRDAGPPDFSASTQSA